MIIYKTTNLVNGKIYIGQDSNNNSDYIGSGLLLSSAIKKYGKNNFKKETLEQCFSKKELDEKEKYWINFFNSTDKKIGYNISRGGTGGKLIDVEVKKGKTYEEYYGTQKANEIKAKLSKKRMGKYYPPKKTTKKEMYEKISQSLKGKSISEDSKKKISKTLKKFYKTEKGLKARKEIVERNKTFMRTEESNKKRSLAMKGKKNNKSGINPNAQYWFFYDRDNNLVLETLGDRTKRLKELGTNQKRIVIFTDLKDCLNHKLDEKKDYKIFTKKYYSKNE